MPSYSINLADPQAVLRVLVTIIEEQGGILEFRSMNYDKMDRSKLLAIDYDPEKGVNTLRVLGNSSAVVPVAPEAHAWTQPPQVAPREIARSAAAQAVARSHAPTDEELAIMEEENAKKAALARLEREGKAPLNIRTQH